MYYTQTLIKQAGFPLYFKYFLKMVKIKAGYVMIPRWNMVIVGGSI